jgi:adenylosuccinate lyase
MARTVRANSIVGLENVALWHERDISHSSAERIVLPDSSATLDYMLAKTTSLLDTLVVYPENMLKNLNITHGLVFSGQLLLALTQKGVSREDAYAWTQRNAMKVWDEGGEYQELVTKDADIASKLSPEEIARVFDLRHYLRNVDKVFERVFT